MCADNRPTSSAQAPQRWGKHDLALLRKLAAEHPYVTREIAAEHFPDRPFKSVKWKVQKVRAGNVSTREEERIDIEGHAALHPDDPGVGQLQDDLRRSRNAVKGSALLRDAILRAAYRRLAA